MTADQAGNAAIPPDPAGQTAERLPLPLKTVFVRFENATLYQPTAFPVVAGCAMTDGRPPA
jgi:hypothetical protein